MSQKLDWRPHGGVAAVVNKKGRRLMLIAGQSDRDGWNLLAVEGPGGTPTAEEVFDNHAHDAVANDVPLETALRLGEVYAEAWLAGDAEALEKCKCPTIRAPEMGPEGELEELPCDGCSSAEGEHHYGRLCARYAAPPAPISSDEMFSDAHVVMRCDGTCEVCREMGITDEMRAVQRKALDAYKADPKACPGCRELDGEHHFGETCSLEEKLSPFHLHLEKCAQCREHPFALCTKGLTLLQAEA